MNANIKFDFDIIYTNIKNGSYKYIGSGSGRRVYDLGNGYVIKAAKNSKGIAQNKEEFHISSVDKSGLFAKTPEVSKDFVFLIMEKADRISNISYVWKYFNVHNNKELFQLDNIYYIFDQYHLIRVDLSRSNSWGFINGRPVIIDYGFTKSVKRKYYFPF